MIKYLRSRSVVFVMISVNILVEGSTDEPVAKRLLNHLGLEVGTVYGRRGKS